MRRLSAIASAVVLCGACSGEAPGEDQSASARPVPVAAETDEASALVGDSAVGCLEIGASVERVRTRCGEVADSVIYLEGSPQEALAVNVGRGRALAEIVDDSVWRIRIDDPALSTSDSIAVGTPVRALADLPGIHIVHGEGTFARTGAHCGKSFEVDGVPFRPQGWSAAQLRRLPESARVAGILVLGRCDGP